MKKALIVGIDNYANAPLYGCVNDATAMAKLLERNADGSPNFSVKKALNIDARSKLRYHLEELFKGSADMALLYFSGHGYFNPTGGYLVTPDCTKYDMGVSMDEVLLLANNSEHRSTVIILDCCHSGAFGNPLLTGKDNAFVKEGLTILTSCTKKEAAMEKKGHGVFTSLLLQGLSGGAADIQGRITPGSLYSYIDQSMGAWEQRPVFKTNVSKFTVLREVHPIISSSVLRRLPGYFTDQTAEYNLDPSYEPTNHHEVEHKVLSPYANPEHVAIFRDLQLLESAGLVAPVGSPHMYFAAMESRSCQLTPLGHHYWRLAKEERL